MNDNLRQNIDYERLAELDSAVQEIARRLGFMVREVEVDDDRAGDWPPSVVIRFFQVRKREERGS